MAPSTKSKQGDFNLPRHIEQPLAFFQVERRSGEPRPLAVVSRSTFRHMTGEEMERLRGALQHFPVSSPGHSALYAVMAFGMNVKVHRSFF